MCSHHQQQNKPQQLLAQLSCTALQTPFQCNDMHMKGSIFFFFLQSLRSQTAQHIQSWTERNKVLNLVPEKPTEFIFLDRDFLLCCGP
jgi:hypothetical protein